VAVVLIPLARAEAALLVERASGYNEELETIAKSMQPIFIQLLDGAEKWGKNWIVVCRNAERSKYDASKNSRCGKRGLDHHGAGAFANQVRN